jgi:hypothetical protein
VNARSPIALALLALALLALGTFGTASAAEEVPSVGAFEEGTLGPSEYEWATYTGGGASLRLPQTASGTELISSKRTTINREFYVATHTRRAARKSRPATWSKRSTQATKSRLPRATRFGTPTYRLHSSRLPLFT